VSEPAVFVKYRNKGSQVWSMDKFENKLIDMRDIYQERKEKGPPLQVLLSLCLRPRARAVPFLQCLGQLSLLPYVGR